MMKRLTAMLVLVLAAMTASAQSHFGVIGGLSLSSAPKFAEIADGETYKAAALYHAGLSYQYRFTQGFSVQPSVIYQVKGTNLLRDGEVAERMRMGGIEIPVALQWGPDLLLFRPFVEVVPYVGFNLFCSDSSLTPKVFEAGAGLGGGIEIWKLQISARYNWNFTPYCKAAEGSAKPWSFRCTTVSLALLF